MAKLISQTYGEALVELAVEENKTDDFIAEITMLLGLLEENKEFGELMNHPKIVKEEKIKVIEDIFTGKVSKELVGLMRMVVEKDHYNELNEVFLYFINQVKEYKNIGTAYVTSAIELNDSQKQAVLKRLLETTKYVEFEMHYDVDAALIGGMKIRIGDRVVDSSIQNKLYNLTRELSNMTI